MPQTIQGSFFAAGSHTSYAAAVASDRRRGAKMRAYLQVLARGPLTDHEAAQALALPIQSICSIRNGLITAQLVTKGFTTRPGPYGHQNCTWDLTREGRAAVRAMGETT